jgi:hypothetical protein
MDDEEIGQLLDRGLTSTAYMKIRRNDKNVPITYDAGERVPNLILTPPDNLIPGANQLGDTSYMFPGTFGNPPGGNGGVRTPAATYNVPVRGGTGHFV